MAELVSVSEAARLLNLDKSVVSRQVRRFNIMRDGKRFDLAEYESLRANALNPLMARRADGEEPSAPAPAPVRTQETFGGSALGKASTAHKALQARLLQLDLDERQGRLVSKAEVDEAMTTASRKLRDKLMALPSRVAIEGVGLEQGPLKALVDQLLRGALDEFTKDLESGGGEEAEEEASPA